MRFAWLLLSAVVVLAQEVRITWVGQACFLIQTPDGRSVIADPPAANIGYPLPAGSADVVTVTHNHGDHNNVAGVRGTPTVVDGRPVTARATMTAADMPFVLIPGFHDNQNGAQRGANTIIQWTQGGLRFAHFGDYGQDQLSEAQLADLQNIDVAFVPAGGFFTIDGGGASRLLAQLRPRVAVLMHFRTALGGPVQLAPHPAVVEPFPEIVYKPAIVTITRDRLPASPEVWVMEPAADAAAVNAAGFAAGAPVAAGSLVSLFGNFTGSQTAAATEVPLPRRLGTTEVLVGGNAAALFYVSPAQINFQTPNQPATGQAIVEVRVDGQRVARSTITLVPSAPGVFVVTNQDGRINAPGRPARRGEVLTLFATGPGETNPVVPDGVAPPSLPLAVTPQAPQVMLGSRAARVTFTGLAPGLVGVWQINAIVPDDAPTGAAVPLQVVYGRASNVVPIGVQ